MIQPVSTRWNSLNDAIGRSLELRPALEKLLSMTKYSAERPANKSLRRFRLTADEWLLLEQLHPILKVSAYILCPCLLPTLIPIGLRVRCLFKPQNVSRSHQFPSSTKSYRSLTPLQAAWRKPLPTRLYSSPFEALPPVVCGC